MFVELSFCRNGKLRFASEKAIHPLVIVVFEWSRITALSRMRLEFFDLLKGAGAFVLAIASFGLLVYDGRYANTINNDVVAKFKLQDPGPESILYSCPLVSAIFSAFVVVALLAVIVTGILLHTFHSFWIFALLAGGAVFFLGVLVASPVGVSTVSRRLIDLYYLLDSRNFNESAEIRSYVNARVIFNAAKLSKSGYALRMSGFAGNKSVRDSSFSDAFNCIDEIKNVYEVETTKGIELGTWNYAISYLPLTNDLVFDWQVIPDKGVEPPRPPKPPSLTTSGYFPYWSSDGRLLAQNLAGYAEVPICYGVEYDQTTVIQVGLKGDLCLLKIARSQECAPGWDVDKILDYLCTLFEECIQDLEDDTREERLADLTEVGIIGVSSSNYYSQWDVDQKKRYSMGAGTAWVFPSGWNRLSDLRGYHQSHQVDDWNEEIPILSYCYYAFNLSFLVIGVVGWVFLILGLVGQSLS
jgi:hypothetical protein